MLRRQQVKTCLTALRVWATVTAQRIEGHNLLFSLLSNVREKSEASRGQSPQAYPFSFSFPCTPRRVQNVSAAVMRVGSHDARMACNAGKSEVEGVQSVGGEAAVQAVVSRGKLVQSPSVRTASTLKVLKATHGHLCSACIHFPRRTDTLPHGLQRSKHDASLLPGRAEPRPAPKSTLRKGRRRLSTTPSLSHRGPSWYKLSSASKACRALAGTTLDFGNRK